MANLLYFAIPVFVILLVLEAIVSAKRDVRGYETRDTFASLAMGIGNVALGLLAKFYALALWTWAGQFALFEIPNTSAIAWVFLILGEDLCYYWFHRFHHEIRFFWAAHVNHHSSRRYNLSTALRQSWTTPITGPIFWVPLALAGFSPAMILTAQAISLIYQFWIHTELIGRLGPFEWIFNTPSHHRVHHGRNVEYLDRNYAGILIVWDRLFGTFEPEVAPVDYGLTKNISTFNPVRIAFHEWSDMLASMGSAGNWGDGLRYLLRPPGWSPDGSTLTAPQLKAQKSA